MGSKGFVCDVCRSTSFFPSFPNPSELPTQCTNFEVPIITSTLESGISLANQSTVEMSFCNQIPLSHHSHVQISQRSRDAKRHLIFVEKELPYPIMQKSNELFRKMQVVQPDICDRLLLTAVTMFISEVADTFNHNHIPWGEDRKIKRLLAPGSKSEREVFWYSSFSTTQQSRQGEKLLKIF